MMMMIIIIIITIIILIFVTVNNLKQGAVKMNNKIIKKVNTKEMINEIQYITKTATLVHSTLRPAQRP